MEADRMGLRPGGVAKEEGARLLPDGGSNGDGVTKEQLHGNRVRV
jgi:hypothetical protein